MRRLQVSYMCESMWLRTPPLKWYFVDNLIQLRTVRAMRLVEVAASTESKPTHQISVDNYNSHRARHITHPEDIFYQFLIQGGIFFAKHIPSCFRRNPKLCSFRTRHSQFDYGKPTQNWILFFFFFFFCHSHFSHLSGLRRNLMYSFGTEKKQTMIS